MLRVSASFDGEIDESTPLQLSPAPSRPSSEGPLSSSSTYSWRDVLNASSNIVNTILGGGMLALPFALKSCGVVFGALLLVLFFVLARYTGGLIVQCAKLGRDLSLADMAESAFGGPGRVLVEISLILFSYGALVGYIVIIGDVWTPYVNMWMFACDRRLVMLFWGLLVCFPLSCLRRISLLRFTSFVALVFIAYLVCCIVGWGIAGFATGLDSSRVVVFSLDVQFLAVLPIIGFAFSFQVQKMEGNLI
jgi:amino acid permease